jgi:hypothetical protein
MRATGYSGGSERENEIGQGTGFACGLYGLATPLRD